MHFTYGSTTKRYTLELGTCIGVKPRPYHLKGEMVVITALPELNRSMHIYKQIWRVKSLKQ